MCIREYQIKQGGVWRVLLELVPGGAQVGNSRDFVAVLAQQGVINLACDNVVFD
jgi:hypothetical protein